MSDYPECEKLKETEAERNIIGDFLEWLLNEKGLDICEFKESYETKNENDEPRTITLNTIRVNRKDREEEEEPGAYMRTGYTRDRCLEEFFNIDMKKVEKERCAMLEACRQGVI